MKNQQTLECDYGCLARSNSIFTHLTKEELEKVNLHKSAETFRRGAVLYLEGSRINGCYIVHSGIIKVYKTGIDGK